MMDDEKDSHFNEEYEYEESTLRRVADFFTAPFRVLISKEAQNTYLGAFLFFSTSLVLAFVAAAAYWVFYFNYIPQIGLKRVVHLQFGDEPPWGVTGLGTDLVSLQSYDVGVSLKLPRTPANLAVGNFMLDLELISPPQNSILGSNTSTSLITHSRRPAILTYTSPLTDTAHTLFHMPLYLIGWQKEAETLNVPMFENLEFARGWQNVPASLRLEIQSREQMQVYSVEVEFRAKFSGLRWLMYNWRLLSFFAFTSLFWSTSMISSSIAWLLLSHYLKPKAHDDQQVNEKTEDNNTSVKEEFGGASIKDENSDMVKQEEIETTNTPSLSTQSGSEAENVDIIRAMRHDDDSGRGTAFDGHNTAGAQRRRSHDPDLLEP